MNELLDLLKENIMFFCCVKSMQKKMLCFVCDVILINIFQTYLNELLNLRWCILYFDHHDENIYWNIGFHASFCMDHILRLLMALFRLSGKKIIIP